MFRIDCFETGNYANVEVEAREHEYSVFPVLVFKPTCAGSHRNEYEIQRANFGLPGYYVTVKTYTNGETRPDDSRIVTAYLTDAEDREDDFMLKDLPKAALRKLVRSYVHLTLANFFSRQRYRFAENGYTSSQRFPKELKDAIDKFVDMEVEQILGK